MTHNASMFKELNHSYSSKVTIDNRESLYVKGKGIVVIETPSSTKYIYDCLEETKDLSIQVDAKSEKTVTATLFSDSETSNSSSASLLVPLQKASR
ncbi:hypothetical protein CR513_34791, partial [Mucuna pruriens]